ncbi:NAD(P)-binding protein [Rhodovastum atsumiense]|uniref:NAD(P)-binding protein n=1 Tax=Rhodovastum atsumiense TaxID=504468 RepID=A0A5M6J2M3_9PROT|nr:FAD-dependent oxidoreductase [Rhodovastum atsumiense]KAA5614754.1 NAD(P)-binding protein [Rhodovastum atsumiense]CAH2599699.1 NAD(P)-binding protein [Rhodovastum atsumiense]
MARVHYGVWNGVVHDHRQGGTPETGDLAELRDFDAFNEGNAIRAFLGDRGFFVFDPHVSLIDALWRYMDKAAEQSCGKCTPCRMGTQLVRDALDGMRRGVPGGLGLDDITALAAQMDTTSLCGLGQTCAKALLAALAHFRDQIEAEIAAAPLPDQYGMTYMTAPCIEACPSKVNVPRYIDYIRDGKPAHSLGVILQKYPMAATCGRVCVRFCEMACRRNLVDEAVGIKTLKRYVADQQQGANALMFTRDMIAEPLGPDMRVAVIGAGPAGISCAYHLLLHGYHVDILEAMDEAGGMAAIGIPSYRLPKDVLHKETDIITALGGHLLFGQALGRDFSIDELFERGYRAVFLSIGCQQGSVLGVEGEDPEMLGYETGIGFLLKVHDHVAGLQPMPLSGEVVVVGGGNVAMDCVRSALRMGAEKVHLVYRRTREDMPADREEIEAAEAEGVIFHYLTNPTRVLAENGRVAGIELTGMRQGEPDAKGRRNVVAVPDSGWTLRCNTLIAAIGQQVSQTSLRPEDGIAFDRWNCVKVNSSSLATSRPGVFAGGDCASGPSTLVHAMSNGLKAARNIDDWIRLGHVRFAPRSRMRHLLADHHLLAVDSVEFPVKHLYRVHHPELDPELRRQMFEEVEQTISQADAYREAKRCLRCYRIYSVITDLPIPEGAA